MARKPKKVSVVRIQNLKPNNSATGNVASCKLFVMQ